MTQESPIKSKYQLCRLEQLARLGLPAHLFVPALLKELHHDIASISNSFFWQNQNGTPDTLLDESINIDVTNELISSMSSGAYDKYTHANN